MSIEEEVFQRSHVDFSKLCAYGFSRQGEVYQYSTTIMDHSFEVVIEIDSEGTVQGKVMDLSFGDEYTTFRIEGEIGSYAGTVREAYRTILEDIKKHCFIAHYFLFEQSNRISQLIQKKFGDEPEFEWEKFPGFATYRNQNSKKWYALLMNLDKSKLEKKAKGIVEILNLKLDSKEIETLLKRDGFYPAYHMNKKNWITILLDDTVPDEEIFRFVEESYSYTVSSQKKKNEWIIPANPKYFDIEKELAKKKTILWKESTNIQVEDLVYLYDAEPFSYEDAHLRMKEAMKLQLLRRYEKGKLSLEKLKEFGVFSVRGPRHMPLELSEYLKKIR